MEENQNYRWVTHGRHSCERCSALDGKEMSLDSWRSSVLPGMHAGCDCSLEALEEIYGAQREKISSLKINKFQHGAIKTSKDKCQVVSHGALKPAKKKLKAKRPCVNNRPLDSSHYGG